MAVRNTSCSRRKGLASLGTGGDRRARKGVEVRLEAWPQLVGHMHEVAGHDVRHGGDPTRGVRVAEHAEGTSRMLGREGRTKSVHVVAVHAGHGPPEVLEATAQGL